MPEDEVTQLSDLDIDEVSFVDRGANPYAKVLIHKRDEEGEEEEIEEASKADPGSTDLSTKGDDEEDEDKPKKTSYKKSLWDRLISKVSDKEFTTGSEGDGNLTHMSDDVTKAAGMNLPFGFQQQGQPAPGPQGGFAAGPQAFPAGQMGQQMPNTGAPQMGGMPGQQQQPGQQTPGQEMPGQMPGQDMAGQIQAGPPLPQEVIDYVKNLEQALAEAQGQQFQPGNQEDDTVSGNNNPFGKNLDHLDDDEASFLQDLAKNLEDEDLREQVTKAQDLITKANERAEEAEKIAKFERDHRETQEYITKAKSLVNLPVSPDDFGPVLKRLHEHLEAEDAEMITKALSAANESIASAGTFTEIGKRGIDGYGSVSKAETLAQEMVEKSDDITEEQALSKVFESRPDLYDEYLQQSR